MNLTVRQDIVLVVREPPRKGEREIRIPLRKTASEATTPDHGAEPALKVAKGVVGFTVRRAKLRARLIELRQSGEIVSGMFPIDVYP